MQFNGVRCRANETLEESEKKEKFACLPAYHKMRKALDGVVKGRISSLSISQRDAAATALSLYKNEDTLRAKLTEAGFQAPEIDALAGLTGFSKFGHLSLKACRKLIPHLEQGLTYDQACSAAGYDFKGHGAGERAFTLPAAAPEMEQITSPVVRRAVAQTIKVVNGIIREMDASPAWVRIELARELSKTFGERQEMDRSMRENAAQNERLMQELRDTFHLLSPTGQDLVKYRLWKEQDGVCAYSLRRLDVERLFEPGYVDVDHIVPYSEWKEMREEDFIFSLYPNDLVYAEHNSGLKFTLQNADSTLEKTRTQTSAFAYFVSGSISTASITIRTHDNAYGIPSLGVKTLKTFHKYQVDVLGNVFPVHKETRQKFR